MFLNRRRAVVAHNVTAMRAEPDGRKEQVSQAIFGEVVGLLQEDGDYAEIETPDGYHGWALAAHLTELEEGTTYPDPARRGVVSALFLPVLREPSGRSERLTLLTLGSVVELATGGARADYCPIRLPGGETGYLESNSLLIPEYPPPETLGPNLVVVARGMIGVPYLWGGRTPFGMDCSGFMQRVYALCGHIIPRDAYLQARWERFTPVDREDLRAGDLVFFAGDHDPRGRGVTHVGMALGGGRFIHASGGSGVVITALDTPPHDRQFCGARRL
jgi:hypothetical protein